MVVGEVDILLPVVSYESVHAFTDVIAEIVVVDRFVDGRRFIREVDVVAVYFAVDACAVEESEVLAARVCPGVVLGTGYVAGARSDEVDERGLVGGQRGYVVGGASVVGGE